MFCRLFEVTTCGTASFIDGWKIPLVRFTCCSLCQYSGTDTGQRCSWTRRPSARWRRTGVFIKVRDVHLQADLSVVCHCEGLGGVMWCGGCVFLTHTHTDEHILQAECCQKVGRALLCIMAVTGSTSCHTEAAGFLGQIKFTSDFIKRRPSDIYLKIYTVCVCERVYSAHNSVRSRHNHHIMSQPYFWPCLTSLTSLVFLLTALISTKWDHFKSSDVRLQVVWFKTTKQTTNLL